MQLQKITKSGEATTTQKLQATRLLHLRIMPPPFFPQRLGARAVASTIPVPIHSNPNAASAGVAELMFSHAAVASAKKALRCCACDMASSRADAKREATASPVEERWMSREWHTTRQVTRHIAQQDSEVGLEKGGGDMPVETRDATMEGSDRVGGGGREEI